MTNPTRLFYAATVLMACSSLGCSSESTTQQDPGTPVPDAGTPEPDTDAGATVVTLKAPVITALMAMAGGLHVTWSNTQKDCDAIEGERKLASDPYKVAFTIADGSVDNKHDGPLKAGSMYTYRVRCKKGSAYSPYSNEKSGKP